jgi:predicted nucleic acid-binding protein
MAFVVDNSVAISWCFADERTPVVMALLDRTIREGAVAPQLRPLEALNALFVAERRQRITRAQRFEVADFLFDLPIEIDAEHASTSLNHPSWRAVEPLCERYSLTAYDASYLALAFRRQVPLATRDKALIAAAKAAAVPLLETL